MEFTCLRWEQLPGIALYMDQVLLVLGEPVPPPRSPPGCVLVMPAMGARQQAPQERERASALH